jgi:hypothetical protein
MGQLATRYHDFGSPTAHHHHPPPPPLTSSMSLCKKCFNLIRYSSSRSLKPAITSPLAPTFTSLHRAVRILMHRTRQRCVPRDTGSGVRRCVSGLGKTAAHAEARVV